MKLISVLLFLLLALTAKANPLDSIRTRLVKGKVFIVHRVEKGEGLYAIARRYSIDVKLILGSNPEKAAALSIGEEILVPYLNSDTVLIKRGLATEQGTRTKILETPRIQEQPVRLDETHANAESQEKDRNDRHIVQQGETVQRIAQRYHITIAELVKWNGIRDNIVEVGQSLIISPSAALKPFESWNKPNSVSGSSSSAPRQLMLAETVEQTGFLRIVADTGVLHQEAPVGTLMLITNLDNGSQCYARVSGKFHSTSDIVAQVGSGLQRRLRAEGNIVRVLIRYAAIEPY